MWKEPVAYPVLSCLQVEREKERERERGLEPPWLWLVGGNRRATAGLRGTCATCGDLYSGRLCVDGAAGTFSSTCSLASCNCSRNCHGDGGSLKCQLASLGRHTRTLPRYLTPYECLRLEGVGERYLTQIVAGMFIQPTSKIHDYRPSFFGLQLHHRTLFE